MPERGRISCRKNIPSRPGILRPTTCINLTWKNIGIKWPRWEGRRDNAMIKFNLDEANRILTVSPEGKLEAEDFAQLAEVVDPFLEEHGPLRGLLIKAEAFPGWQDFAALISHLRFVKAHHTRIDRVAAVTDSGFLSVLPQVANHFVKAEVRHFPYQDRQIALDWLLQT